MKGGWVPFWKSVILKPAQGKWWTNQSTSRIFHFPLQKPLPSHCPNQPPVLSLGLVLSSSPLLSLCSSLSEDQLDWRLCFCVHERESDPVNSTELKAQFNHLHTVHSWISYTRSLKLRFLISMVECFKKIKEKEKKSPSCYPIWKR